MKKSLIALAAAGVLGTGVAAADSIALRFYEGSPAFVGVQNYQHDSRNQDDWRNRDDWRNWHNDGRRVSINERQQRIHERIERGFEQGQLTRREARQLTRELYRIEAKERDYEADGRLNRRELADLHNDLDHLVQRLRFERRDAETRY